jgi:nondiscriminating aspartyl-tRNA synthetase
MRKVPVWEFGECLERLGREDLVDDLDPEAERALCRLAEAECGVAAVFVLGFPLSARPFYTHPRVETVGGGGTAAGFDLLFEGVEITTGGQRLHRRSELERFARAVCPRMHSRAICGCSISVCPRTAALQSDLSG